MVTFASTPSIAADTASPTLYSLPPGAGAENFAPTGRDPVAITQGTGGTMWVGEENAGSLAEVSPSGQVTEHSLGSGHVPVALTSDPNGDLWWAEGYDGTNPPVHDDLVATMAPSGQITDYATPSCAPAGLPAQLSGLAWGPDGNLWVPIPNCQGIERVTPSGSMTFFPTAGVYPQNITSGPDGSLWFTDAHGIDQGAVGRMTTAGAFTVFASGLPGPEGITTGPDGALWFVESQANEVARISVSGQVAQFAVPITPSADIVSGPDGKLWFGASGSLVSITTTGVAAETSIPEEIPLSNVFDVAPGPNGTIWATLGNADQIAVLQVVAPTTATTTSTTSSTVVATSPSTTSGVSRPLTRPSSSLAFTGAGAQFRWMILVGATFVLLAAVLFGVGDKPRHPGHRRVSDEPTHRS